MLLRGLVRGWVILGLLAAACAVGRGQDKPVSLTMWKGEPMAHVGGGVSAPNVLHSVEPQMTEEMWKKYRYVPHPLVYLIVDKEGLPQNVHVVKSSGDTEFDAIFVEAVKQDRFKPALENGKPVPVELSIEIDWSVF